MSGPHPGDKAPDSSAPTDGGETLKLSSLKGKNVILYFYPKDDTPGCTKEACGFRDTMEQLANANTVVLGVSRDSVKRHDNFKAKYDLNFRLVSDEDGAICEAYGVWVEKMNYGRTYMGIERSTYLIDAKGKINQVWRKVRVKNHVAAVAEAAGTLG